MLFEPELVPTTRNRSGFLILGGERGAGGRAAELMAESLSQNSLTSRQRNGLQLIKLGPKNENPPKKQKISRKIAFLLAS